MFRVQGLGFRVTALSREHVLDEVLRAFEQLMTFGRDQLDPDGSAEIANHVHTNHYTTRPENDAPSIESCCRCVCTEP